MGQGGRAPLFFLVFSFFFFFEALTLLYCRMSLVFHVFKILNSVPAASVNLQFLRLQYKYR